MNSNILLVIKFKDGLTRYVSALEVEIDLKGSELSFKPLADKILDRRFLGIYIETYNLEEIENVSLLNEVLNSLTIYSSTE